MMSGGIMAHRMQITLTDDQYARLRRRSEQTGTSIAELIRRRLDEPSERYTLEERLQAVRDTAGMWTDEPDAGETGAEYLERMRPGFDERMRRRDR
jgi:hypothetical protein